jgi:hypothetical protein
VASDGTDGTILNARLTVGDNENERTRDLLID